MTDMVIETKIFFHVKQCEIIIEDIRERFNWIRSTCIERMNCYFTNLSILMSGSFIFIPHIPFTTSNFNLGNIFSYIFPVILYLKIIITEKLSMIKGKRQVTYSTLEAPVMTTPGASKVAPPINFPIPYFSASFVGSYKKQAQGHSPKNVL